ncbi:unnamed protein product, partial [Acanthoscelides obtectus]
KPPLNVSYQTVLDHGVISFEFVVSTYLTYVRTDVSTIIIQRHGGASWYFQKIVLTILRLPRNEKHLDKIPKSRFCIF